MEPLVVAAVGLLALAGGAVLGFVARGLFPSRAMKEADEKSALIIEKARSQQKDLILDAKEEKIRLQREAEDEARAKRTELANLERRLLQRDEQLDQRADMLEGRDRKLLEREREIDRAREEVARAHQEQVEALERVSGMSGDDAKAMLLEAVREEAEHDAVKLARAIERARARGRQRQGPRRDRHRHPASGGRPHGRAHRDRDPPALRRDEGPDHRP